METPIQITFHKVPHSDAVEAHIREKATKLEEFHPRITSCRVTVEEQRKHHHQGHHFSVKIDVRVPGKKEIVVNRQHDEDIYVALRDALAAARLPFIEVHLSNIFAREFFRRESYFSDLALGVISGLGAKGYILALHYALSAH